MLPSILSLFVIFSEKVCRERSQSVFTCQLRDFIAHNGHISAKMPKTQENRGFRHFIFYIGSKTVYHKI